MSTLFIAEKPDIGRTIAEYLWPGGYQKTKHYYHSSTDVTVTWAYGHILRMAEPAEYDEDFKAWAKYPIFPTDWKLMPVAGAKEQLDAIGKLLKSMIPSSTPATRTGKASFSSTRYYSISDMPGPFSVS